MSTKLSDRMHTFSRLLKLLKGSKKWMLLSLLLSLAAVALTLYLPILVGDAIDFMIAAGQVDMPSIVRILILIGVSVCITALSQWLIGILSNKITYAAVADIRERAIRKIEALPVSYLDSHASGDILSRVIADADTVADGLLLGFTQFFTGIMTILGTLLFMLSIHIPITLLVVVMTPLSFFVAKFIVSKTYHLFQKQGDTRAEQTAFLNETITNQRVVQAFGHEDEVLETFDDMNARLTECTLKATFFSSLTNPSTRFVNALVYAAVGITGALAAVSGNISIGGLSCFLSYANQYTKPFHEISGVMTELQNAMAYADRIFRFLDQPERPADIPDARVLEDADGNVCFEDVSFSYVPERPLITDCNLRILPGQRVAIVGPTGCGKTTLMNLLMRFYDVTDGSISVDGSDLREITRDSLRKNFGMVLQETWLSGASIRDNIRMGKPDASEEEVIAAAKAAHAHSFIRRLPQGYDTVISDKTGGLSQGQRQLLCIARLMLALPPMLILDEATSSIDTRTEQKIQSAFQTMMQGRTSFIVAHRLSTIQQADLILVMNNGNIIEQGNHDTLIAQNGFYAKLFQSQFAP